MQGSRCPTFALHFDYGRNGSPEISSAFGCPTIGPFTHRRGGSDRINSDHFTETIGNARNSFVTVYGCIGFFGHVFPLVFTIFVGILSFFTAQFRTKYPLVSLTTEGFSLSVAFDSLSTIGRLRQTGLSRAIFLSPPRSLSRFWAF
ncbi:hypothetical protein MICAI_2190008 [Microcystis sp. T1-4]|nr:hypothetical protein MICAI_2190008 [Microcystis sp. T1-4]